VQQSGVASSGSVSGKDCVLLLVSSGTIQDFGYGELRNMSSYWVLN